MLKKTLFIILSLLPALLAAAPGATAAQVQLPATSIPRFVDPLPLLDVQGGGMQTVVYPAGETTTDLYMREFRANILPSTFQPASGTYTGTTVWGYRTGAAPAAPADTYIGPVFVTQRGTPTGVKFINALGNTGSSQLTFWKTAVDQTLHWADPLGGEMNSCAMEVLPGTPPAGDCSQNYIGPVPAVPHLHGGENPPVIDGGPDQWFLSEAPNPVLNPGAKVHGHAFYSMDRNTAGNYAIYRYPNVQEAAPLWFHDHLLGGTRLNVYAGLAGAYLLQDAENPPPADLGDPTKIIPLVVQDRSFDTYGELFFPSTGINPEHPYWIPEFTGDVNVVNGKTWPYLNVEPGLYRFLIINGANARTYNLFFAASPNAKIWQVETDGGYLPAPVRVGRLLMMPGERAGIIVDFRGCTPGQNVYLYNDAATPFPDGDPVLGTPLHEVMVFRVKAAADPSVTAPSVTFDPAALPAPNLRPTNPIVRLPAAPGGPGPVRGPRPAGNVQQVRQLTLNEVMDAGGPEEVLLNNLKWSGLSTDTVTYPGGVRPDTAPLTLGGMTDYIQERVREGDTEIWEIVNLTADAHPIHLHLVQFQLISRQDFDLASYDTLYQSLFPGGTFVPGFGPPLNYGSGNPRALGGNPDVVPFLTGGTKTWAQPNERGWKDTVRVMPGQVTKLAVRYAPQDKAVGDADSTYLFDPFAGHRPFVWHCHIVDHEDNEMMHPYIVLPDPAAVRESVFQTDY